jgi:hypothetical protein
VGDSDGGEVLDDVVDHPILPCHECTRLASSPVNDTTRKRLRFTEKVIRSK